MARPTKEEQERKRQEEATRIAEAVRAGLAEVKAQIRADIEQEVLMQLAATRPDAPPAPASAPGVQNLTQPRTDTGDRAFASTLALMIANLSSQGTGKAPYVAPEVMEGWDAARARMTALIMKARTDGVGDEGAVPRYRVTKKQYLNETQIEPQWFNPQSKAMQDTLIFWDEVPNDGMAPVNDAAAAIFAEFRNSIGETVTQRKDPSTPWVRTDKRLFRGMSPEQRDAAHGTRPADPRIAGSGAPTSGKHVNLLGTIAAPAMVR